MALRSPEFPNVTPAAGALLDEGTERFTVDLVAGRWCSTEDCNTANMAPIERVTPATLVLREPLSINRADGRLWGTNGVIIRDGNCVRAGYTRPDSPAI